MENKYVGMLLLGISIFMILVVALFNNSAKHQLENSCSIIQGGQRCPAFDSLNQLTMISLAITGILILLGLILIFSKPHERIIIKKVPERKPQKEVDDSTLKPEERQAFALIREHKAVFQAELMEKLSVSKVRMTRILDHLEGMGLIERKRRGMTNVVVLKD